jgi:hypothetical protein
MQCNCRHILSSIANISCQSVVARKWVFGDAVVKHERFIAKEINNI